jgi:hypothetical protein
MSESLIKKFVTDEMTAAEWRELKDRVENDEVVRSEYIRAVEFEALLSIALENRIERAESALKIQETVDAVDSKDFVAEFQMRARHRHYRGLAVAAALVIAGAFFWFRNTEVIATVTRLDRVIYGSAGESFAEGTKINRGTLIDFEEGLVEVSLNSRDRLIIQGPARVEFTRKSGVTLQHGRIVGRLTSASYGYLIKTPEGTAEALGPMLGVAVGDRGRTEVHALQGHLMVSLHSGGKRMVEGPKALRLRDRLTFSAKADEFKIDLSEEISKREAIHWDFDESNGDVAGARLNGIPAVEELNLHLKKIDLGEMPNWVSGVSGSALSFDGKGAFAESPYSGIEGKQPRTVCFWVKVPVDSGTKEGFAIISWGSHSEEQAWQISVQPMENQGLLGRIRIGTFKGVWTGTTDLRDDRWHHVAVVLKKSRLPDVSSDLAVYIDGVDERPSFLLSGGISTSSAPDGHGVWLGRNLERKGEETFSPISNFFRGAIDDVYIFNYPLYPSEIQLMIARKGNVR